MIAALACGIFCWWVRRRPSWRWLPRRLLRNTAGDTQVAEAEVIRAEDLDSAADIQAAEDLAEATQMAAAMAAAAQRIQAARA